MQENPLIMVVFPEALGALIMLSPGLNSIRSLFRQPTFSSSNIIFSRVSAGIFLKDLLSSFFTVLLLSKKVNCDSFKLLDIRNLT